MIYDNGGNGVVTFSNTVAAAGTRQRLLAQSQSRQIAAWITFQPLASNSGAVYLGGNDVSATKGIVISPGTSWVTWPVADINGYDFHEIWIDAANTNDGLQFIYFTR